MQPLRERYFTIALFHLNEIIRKHNERAIAISVDPLESVTVHEGRENQKGLGRTDSSQRYSGVCAASSFLSRKPRILVCSWQ